MTMMMMVLSKDKNKVNCSKGENILSWWWQRERSRNFEQRGNKRERKIKKENTQYGRPGLVVKGGDSQ